MCEGPRGRRSGQRGEALRSERRLVLLLRALGAQLHLPGETGANNATHSHPNIRAHIADAVPDLATIKSTHAPLSRPDLVPDRPDQCTDWDPQRYADTRAKPCPDGGTNSDADVGSDDARRMVRASTQARMQGQEEDGRH